MTSRPTSIAVQSLVIRGLIIGYLYAIILSAASIVVCESQKPGQCSEAWNQGFSTATGFVTTFLAYLIPPTSGSVTLRKREETDASK